MRKLEKNINVLRGVTKSSACRCAHLHPRGCFFLRFLAKSVFCIGVLVFVIAAVLFSMPVAFARETKFIAHGWDCQSAHPEDVLASAEEFDKTVALARRRGREVFSAVFEEKSDAVILAFWLLAIDKNVYNSHDPAEAMSCAAKAVRAGSRQEQMMILENKKER